MSDLYLIPVRCLVCHGPAQSRVWYCDADDRPKYTVACPTCDVPATADPVGMLGDFDDDDGS
jgi:hypothetical protein